MRTLIDFDNALVFAIPAADGVREGVLLEGPQGWGEFSPPADAGDALAARWLTAAMEPGTVGWPDAVRGRVPVSDGVRRATVDGGDVDAAVGLISRLDAAAGGLELVELICRSAEDARAIRARVDVPVAVDARMAIQDRSCADIAIVRCGALGGVRRALRRAETLGLPSLVDFTGLTSIGLAADIAVAAVLPDLPLACGPAARSLADGDVVAQARSLIPVDGYLPAAPMPAAPDPARLAQFTVTDHDTIRQWRDLLRRAAAVDVTASPAC